MIFELYNTLLMLVTPVPSTLVAQQVSINSVMESIKPALVAKQATKAKPAPKVIDTWEVTASWYGVGDGYHGQQAADGSIFDAYKLTAAENTLPFGTRIRVTNLANGKSVIVRITDRGGFTAVGVGIDLSYEAARVIGGVDAGNFPVKIERLR